MDDVEYAEITDATKDSKDMWDNRDMDDIKVRDDGVDSKDTDIYDIIDT